MILTRRAPRRELWDKEKIKPTPKLRKSARALFLDEVHSITQEWLPPLVDGETVFPDPDRLGSPAWAVRDSRFCEAWRPPDPARRGPDRIGRTAVETLALLRDCRTHNVLVKVGPTIYDLRNNNELFITQLSALLVEQDNLGRMAHLEHGRIAKVKLGRAVTAPPAGYERMADGSWALDPDPAVQAGIAAVFRVFLRQRSLKRTVNALKELGAKIPTRYRGRLVRHLEPTIWRIQRILKNPNYTDRYYWRRRRSDPIKGRDPKGRCRTRPSSADEVMVVEQHHPAYVTFAQWNEIQAILRNNAWTRDHANLGPGNALVQGIIRCGRHKSLRMYAFYKTRRRRDGGRAHGYYCQGDYGLGGRQCGSRPGAPIDRVVLDAVVDRLCPPRLQALRQALDEARRGEVSEAHRRQLELHRVRQLVADLEYRSLTVESSNRLVRAELEAKWEAAKKDLLALERAGTTAKSKLSPLSANDFEELVSIAGDLRSLLNAPTTESRDRKELVRTIVKEVVVDDFDRERLVVRIVWNDGEPDTAAEAALNRRAYHTIVRLSQEGLRPCQIAARLNEEGIRTGKDKPWCANSVGLALKRMKRKAGRRTT